MNFFEDIFRLLFFIIIGAVWAVRAKKALKVIRLAPRVIPAEILPEGHSPRVSVLIPAKNEEKNIRSCIERFLNQTYPNIEILAANDNSSDQTEAILKSFGSRIRYVNVPPTPKGWTGKNFAVHTLVQEAHGEWLLFTDADTLHEKESVAAAVAHAWSKDLHFLTLLPRCLSVHLFEHLFQPALMSFTGLWFPLDQINSPASDVYFGNGQFILMSRENYKKTGGHEKVKSEFLEDFALMRETKRQGRRAECALGVAVYGTRMYDTFARMWRGWRRIYLHAFQQIPLVLFQKIVETFVLSFLPFLVWAMSISDAWNQPEIFGVTFGAGTIVCLFMMAVLWKSYEIIQAKRGYCVFFPLAALAAAGILTDAWRMAILKRPTRWR